VAAATSVGVGARAGSVGQAAVDSRQAASLIASMGTLNAEAFFACDAQAARAQWWL